MLQEFAHDALCLHHDDLSWTVESRNAAQKAKFDGIF